MRLFPLLGLILILAQPPAAVADTRSPNNEGEISLSFAPVVRMASPAVVSIYARKVVATRVSPFANDPFFSQFFDFGEAAPRVQNALGSGVVLRADGIVVTNFHVVGDADQIRVVLNDRREFDATVILSDASADLAVLQLAGATDLPDLILADSDQAEVGDLVLAIGNPFGVGQTVTSGIVSGLARAGARLGRGKGYFIQTDASINPGNSGGALVDMKGRLLGINTSILSPSGASNGIGFAIPSNLVARYVEQAEAGATEAVRPWAGIEVQPVDADMAEAIGLPGPNGVAVTHLHPESPFAKAGVVAGDVITAIDGQPVDAPQELDYRLATHSIGARVPLAFWHDGALTEREVELTAAPGGDARPTEIGDGSIFSGLALSDLTPALIDRLGLPLSAEGVVVTGVAGAARQTGLQIGDILIGVNGATVGRAVDFAAAIARGGHSWQVDLIRDGQRAYVQLRG